ncbi:MAG: excinuclease ABC subunit C [Firmicutes bacterium]|nr:excinuclease ABC subunit C [Bacillota bacterium]
MFDIKENLKKLPDSPGVYIHKDKLGQVIYVGKAVSLKNRVRQYFQSPKNMPPKVRSMVSNIEEFEYITAATEMEALILECNLIKKYRPKYNVLLRDDKTYPYIKITTGEKFPRIIKTRNTAKDDGKYFGPYSDAGAVNETVDILNDVYCLKRCTAEKFPKGHRPCLNYHIGKCEGVCTGKADRKKYLDKIDTAADFLKGKNKELESYLTEKMNEAAEAMQYERAADYRDHIIALRALQEKQRVVIKDSSDIDLILTVGGAGNASAAPGKSQTSAGPAATSGQTGAAQPSAGSAAQIGERHIAVFFVRDGKLSGRETFDLQHSEQDTSEELISAFIKQHYAEDINIPREILVAKLPKDAALTEEYLYQMSGRKVSIMVPRKGEKKALLTLAQRDAVEMTKTIDERAESREKRRTDLGSQLHQVLAAMGRETGDYDGRDYRLEAYDISNTNGVDTVGAMVVFEGLYPQKKAYRRFRIRTVEGPNDYGSMQEMLVRRFRRAKEGDTGFSTIPDIILMDGGKGHVNATLLAIRAMGYDVPVVGMVKDDSHRTRALVFEPAAKGDSPVSDSPATDGRSREADGMREIPLKDLPLLFSFMGTIQEEVHRFAIEYHRKKRSSRMTRSVLDEIKGIGPARRNALLNRFGSVEKIKKASAEQLQETDGINENQAREIYDFFHKE